MSYMINAKAANRHRNLLEQINTTYAEGGIVSAFDLDAIEARWRGNSDDLLVSDITALVARVRELEAFVEGIREDAIGHDYCDPGDCSILWDAMARLNNLDGKRLVRD